MRRKTALMVLFTLTVMLIIGVILGFMPALMSSMMFADPKVLESPAAVTLVISVVTFPIICIVAVLLSWLVFLLPVFAHLRYRYLLACGLTTLPLINLATAAATLGWLFYFNDGLSW
ncbi:hypothetical protein [Leptolyngbya subtilissima]|uniref:Uncharacterized protein n=2 Tax=Cyanophyceae TaxID=3028117 RepID=A0ABV0K0U0_9CYAN